jgi:hypothetical protein
MGGLFSSTLSNQVSSYIKSGVDLTISVNPSKVYRDVVIMGGGNGINRTFTPSMIPWVYASQAEAAIACVYWIQKLDTHFKGMDNGNVNFRLANFVQAMSSKLPAQAACGESSFATGIGEPLIATAAATFTASGWMELIVGTDPTKTVVYSMGYQYQLTAQPTYDSTCLYSFRSIFQTVSNAPSAGFQGQPALLNNPGTNPAVTSHPGSFVLPASCSPIWFMPISIECQF